MPSAVSTVPQAEPVAVATRGQRLRSAVPRREPEPPAPAGPPLLDDPHFRNLMVSRLLTQMAQGAILYALLIVLVDQTDAPFFNSIFVVCAIIPAIAFGLPAGYAVDSLPRRPMLVMLNLLRFLFTLALVAKEPSIAGIFAAALGLWTIHQFYAPSESAAMAALVPKERYVSAQAISNLFLAVAQAIGLVILSPVLLKIAGPTTLFACCAALFLVAMVLTALLPPVNDYAGQEGRRISTRPATTVRGALLTGWRIARTDHVMYEVLTDDILVGIGGSALVVIMPLYLKGVLNTGAENTVFVFAPAALGLVVGLRLSPRLSRYFGARHVATAGLILFSISVAALGFVEPIRDFLNDVLLIPTDDLARALHIQPLILLVMLLSIPAGFATSVVSVASRSVLLARTPPSQRGQVIATQSLLQNVGALIPTLLAGVAADLIGVERVAIAIAAIMAIGAVAALTIYRPAPVASVTT